MAVGNHRDERKERSQLPVATTTETNPERSDTEKGLRLNRATKSRKTGNRVLRYRCAKNSEGDRLSLTNSFRKGHIGRSTLTC